MIVTSLNNTPALKKAIEPTSGGFVRNLMQPDAENPVPFERVNGGLSSFILANGYGYIPFLDRRNQFARQLLEASLVSVTHRGCIRTKKYYCAGAGFQRKDGEKIDPAMTEFFKTMNLRGLGQSAVQINRQILESDFIWGNCPIEIVRFKVDGKAKLMIYPHNMMDWRLCEPGADNRVRWAMQSAAFRGSRGIISKFKEEPRKLPLYNPLNPDKENWIQEGNAEKTMIWYKTETVGFDHYGIPSAVASLLYQIVQYKSISYNNDLFDNGMMNSAILALSGNLDQEEADRIGRQILAEKTGLGKTQRVHVVASDAAGGIQDSSFFPLDTTKEGSFIEADRLWMEIILFANEWDATLAGLVSQSTLGKGSDFITTLLRFKYQSVIKPAQDDLMNNFWLPVFDIAEKWNSALKFSEIELEINKGFDISGLADIDATLVAGTKETREALGRPRDLAPDDTFIKPAVVPADTTKPDPNVPVK